MGLEERLAVARGDRSADLVIRGARIVDVFGGEVLEATDVAIAEGIICGIGEGYEGEESFDGRNRVLAPGMIDGHIHVESTFLSPREFARIVVPRGTSAVYWDPHEIANVLGLEGVRSMLEAARDLPVDLRVMASSCVPATDMETSGADLGPEAVSELLGMEGVHGLAEVMNYPGVIHGAPDVLAKIRAAEATGLPVDGHAPHVRGRDLNAYALAGIRADHESTEGAELVEKLRKGLWVLCRESTAERNFDALIPEMNERNAHRFLFVTDDRHPDELVASGHMDLLVREAVKRGVPVPLAIRAVTLNPARCYSPVREGAVAPGYRADLCLLYDLEDIEVVAVWKDGELVARDGELLADLSPEPIYPSLGETVTIPETLDLTIEAGEGPARVIEIVPDQIVTRKAEAEPKVVEGEVVSDPTRDLIKMVVVERHGRNGGVGKGLVRGLGLREGAIASTVAHDSHNVIAAGVTDDAIERAVRAVGETGGGQAVVRDGEVVARLALPIAGLMSTRPADVVAGTATETVAAARSLGSELRDPFMALSFLALPVIPALKLTDRGLVDVEAFEPVPLFGG